MVEPFPKERNLEAEGKMPFSLRLSLFSSGRMDAVEGCFSGLLCEVWEGQCALKVITQKQNHNIGYFSFKVATGHRAQVDTR